MRLFSIRDDNDANHIDEVRKDETKAIKANDDNTSDNINDEPLPAIVTEGKDFRNELPDRLYLDSDPEFHLNLHTVFSYLLLFHIDSHILMVVRRIVTIYVIWVICGIGSFIYLTYYPILLDEPILNQQFRLFGKYMYHR